jgi:hypothetical protein
MVEDVIETWIDGGEMGYALLCKSPPPMNPLTNVEGVEQFQFYI